MNERAATDRIDFTIMCDGAIIVTKMTRHPARRRDIPHMSEKYAPGDLDLEDALAWCRENGYTVKAWPKHSARKLGARAWKGTPWPIRTGHQLVHLRQRLETECMNYVNASQEEREHMPFPSWSLSELAHTDLAFVG